jgi:hypothetical protein
MSLSYIASLFLSLLLGLANTTGMVQSFTASYQGSDVRLEWHVSDAAANADFEIHRKKAGEDSYVKLGDVNGTGSDVYTFIDDNLYKNTDVAQAALSYKLVVKMASGSEQTITGIERNPTAVQRSWGSIKVMFR